MGVQKLEQLLEQERSRLGAASCTFYLRDPLWPFEFRLVCMPGVRYREAMHGYVLTDQAKQWLCSGPDEIFSSQPRDRRSDGTPATLDLAIDPELVSLFQDFVGREGIQSFARLFHGTEAGEVNAVMFVNFSEAVDFSGELKAAIRELLHKAAAFLDGVRKDLRSLDGEYLAESMKILHPAQELASEGLDWKSYFEKMLHLCLDVLQIPSSEGLGTIHLYEPEKGILKLAASTGNAPKISEAQVQLASKGQGIISWVALKQKAILIGNMPASEFRRIKVEVNQEVRSELAVPMIVDGALIGVFNLESTRVEAFRPGSVRSIWYAANSAAVVFQLKARAAATARLLGICEAATKDQEGVRQALRDIAEVLAQTLSADGCDLWHYNSFLGRFDIAGATYRHFMPSLRPGGWSHYIWKTRQPIWLSNISEERRFSCWFWNGEQWDPNASIPGDAPPDVNAMVLKNGMHAELGMPILVGGACVGVAWIKYKDHRQPPTPKRMSEAFRAGSQAGLVLESVQRQVERPDRDQLAKISDQVSVFFTSCALDFGSLPLEGYVVHRPFHSHACGDFHVISQVDPSVIGLLIGDGEGKAVSGLLNALPMITGFEAFGHGSGSTRHVIEKLRSLCRKLGLGGTALYWTFTLARGDVWMAMTSAGHEVPILIRGNPGQARTVPADPGNSRAVGVPLGNDLDWPPQVEHQEQLLPGDVLIAYTDGVSDGMCQGSVVSRKDPTETITSVALEQDRNCSCREMAEAIMAAAERACPLLDDATVCVVRHTVRL